MNFRIYCQKAARDERHEASGGGDSTIKKR